MLRRSYNWLIDWSSHPQALWVLASVAFAESSFFPIPPDPLYIAMILANHENAMRYAWVCTVSSVVGGLLGYYIGYTLYETAGQWIINTYGLEEAFIKFQSGFDEWGFWIVALKGLTPIPYKVVTIFSGVAKLDLSTFMIASFIARGFRFFMVASVLRYCGPQIRGMIDQYLGWVTLLIFGSIVGGFLLIKYL